MPDQQGFDTSIYKIPQRNMLQSAAGFANLDNTILANKTGEFDLALKKMGVMSNAAKSILGLPNPTPSDASTAMQRLVNMGLMTPEAFSREAATMTQAWSSGRTPEEKVNGIRNWAAQHAMQLDSAAAAITARYGTPGILDTGEAQQPITQSAVLGTRLNGPPIRNTTSPGQKIGLVPTYEGNQPGNKPVSEVFDKFGNIRPQTLPGAPAPGGGAGNMAPNGMLPTARTAQGFIPTGPRTGDVADAEVSVRQAADLQSFADNTPNRKAALGQMEALLPEFTSGGGAEAMTRLKSVAGRWGLDFNPKSTAASEEFKKLAATMAGQQAQALGASTDAGRSLSSAATPNVDLSKMGNEQIIKVLKGNEDAIAAKNATWQRYKQANGAGSYGKFSAEFNQIFDPRVFQLPYLSPADRTKLVKSIPEKERAEFGKKLQAAMDAGWVKP